MNKGPRHLGPLAPRPHAPRPLIHTVPAAATAATAIATTVAATAASAAPACCTAMASLRVLAFDHEGRPVQFDTWLDDLQLYLLSDIKDGVSLINHVSGAATAPPTTANSATRSQWLSRDAAARLAIRNHLPLAECAHFGQHRTAQALYDAVVARYSSPTTATLGRLLLPYLFSEMSAFAAVEDLVSHLRASDARYCAAVPAEILDKNQPQMFITLYFILTRLFDSLRSLRDHFLSLDPTSLTIDLLEQHLLAAEISVPPCPALPSLRREAATRRSSLLSRERYFLLVVDDYMRYTTVFPLRSKGQVVDVLIPWIRTLRLQLRERFRTDLPVLRRHSDRGGEFSSDLLRDFFMEVALTSMIHAAAPHFLWPFAVWYAAHQLNLWPRVSLPETSRTQRWTREVGDASVFRFYPPTSRRVFPSLVVTFDESVPFYRLFPYRSAPPPLPPLFLTPGPPPLDPLLPQGPAPSGAASGGATSGGAGPGGAESEGAETGGAEPGGVEPGGGEPGGTEPESVEPGGAASKGAESGGGKPGYWSCRDWWCCRCRLFS
ncbi:unnamed protein product [Closterium sp. NIES-54]